MKLHIAGDAMDLDAEALLCAMVLRQLVLDLRSERPAIRQEAEHFLQNQAALQFWTSSAGLDVELFQQRLAGVERLRNA
jgi:hypothetical protein